MKLKIRKSNLLYIGIFLTTLQNSQVLINYGVGSLIGNVATGLLFIGCIFGYIELDDRKKRRRLLFLFLVVNIFMNIGILQQNLPTNRKISLIISMMLLSSIAIFPNGCLKDDFDFYRLAKYIMIASLISGVLAIIFGVNVVSIATEGFVFDFGFNAGTQHRTYFAYTMLAVLILLDLYKAFTKKNALTLKGMAFVLMVLSNTRSVWIVLAVYLYISNYRTFKAGKISKRINLAILIILLVVVGIPTYKMLINHSYNFQFRFNGLTNYVNYVRGDSFHIWYGNAELAFKNSSYADNIRSVTGWDGSVELVLLNILIKNGLVGVIGYILMFIYIFRQLRIANNIEATDILYGIYVSFLVSALVECFLATLTFPFAPVVYTLLATVPKIEVQSKDEGGSRFI